MIHSCNGVCNGCERGPCYIPPLLARTHMCSAEDNEYKSFNEEHGQAAGIAGARADGATTAAVTAGHSHP